MARRASRRVGVTPLPDRCVIMVPGHDIGVPAIFKSWIYDEPEEKQHRTQRQEAPNTASNQGMIEALQG